MVTIETERVSINKKVEEIISLAGESLRAAYGDEVFPKYERPPRPERLDKIIELVKQSLEARYGPESDTLDPESIFWVSEQEYKDVFEETKEKPPKLLKTALNSLGVPDFWERSLKDNSVFLSNGTVEPLEIYICADRYRHLDLSTFRGRTEFDYQIALKLISHSIFHATVPRFSEDNDHLMGALEQRLELDRKEFPPKYPQLDRDRFYNLIDNLQLMVREDPTRRFILDGTEIKALHGDTAKRLDQNGEAVSVTTYEDFSVTGVAFKEAAACYLAERVLKDFLKILLQEYPQDPQIQKALAIRLNKLDQPSIQQKMETARIETFFKNIGLVGHKNIFRAFYESRIPLIFFQSKQKNKKLVYPR